MLNTIWFILWGLLWTVYFVPDGFDLGLGTLLPVLARDDREKRVIFNAMGPFWDGNEVWLLTAGGVTFAAFPKLYAVMFSAMYTPLMLLLFALIVRGVAFEFRGKIESETWKGIWDWSLTVGSFLPALLLGVAFGNIFEGIPFDAEGVFHGSLLTYLNPYGLLMGVEFVMLFLVHGAIWGALKSEGELRERARKLALKLWPVLLVVTVVVLGASAVATSLWDNYFAYPWLWVFPLVAVVGLVLAFLKLRSGELWLAWLGSALTIAGAVAWGVGGLYPAMFPSSLDPSATLTAFNASSSTLTLGIMLGVALVMVPIVIAYQAWVYTKFHGPVTDEDLAEDEAY